MGGACRWNEPGACAILLHFLSCFPFSAESWQERRRPNGLMVVGVDDCEQPVRWCAVDSRDETEAVTIEAGGLTRWKPQEYARTRKNRPRQKEEGGRKEGVRDEP